VNIRDYPWLTDFSRMMKKADIDKLLSQPVGALGRWLALHTRQMKDKVGDMPSIKPHRHEAVANLIHKYFYRT